MKKIFAIVVTYHPNELHLAALFSSLSKQCFSVVVIDNTESSEGGWDFSRAVGNNSIHIVRLGDNFGVAKALNVGIRYAVAEGADFVLLSDQDSLPEDDMVGRLFSVYAETSAGGCRVGAIGPTFTDLHTEQLLPFQVKPPNRFLWRGATKEMPNKSHVEVMSLITSGSLVPVNVFGDIGLMREDFFIDKVDIEWCHRARARGYELFGAKKAHMYHRLGEGKIKIWYFGWHYCCVYSPLRIYYQVRNYVAMCRLSHVDWRWKLRKGWFTLGLFYLHGLFGGDRVRALSMGLLGLWHGIVSKMGRYQ